MVQWAVGKTRMVNGVLTDEATRIVSSPALYLQHRRMLRPVRDPCHVDGVFVGDLNPSVVLIREVRIGEVVRGEDGRGGGWGKRRCGGGGCGGRVG